MPGESRCLQGQAEGRWSYVHQIGAHANAQTLGTLETEMGLDSGTKTTGEASSATINIERDYLKQKSALSDFLALQEKPDTSSKANPRQASLNTMPPTP